MILATIAALLSAPDSVGPVYQGHLGELAVDPPRLEAAVVVDGVLDEPVWLQAATLTGFSRYAPSDGVPAENRTEVLVWYSPTAIHFGIRAHARPGTVRATLADRDRIFGDDHVLLFLSTFDDGRQALVFGVNPLGVQGDGSMVETGVTSSRAFGGQSIGREGIDVSQDFVYQSTGRLTDDGFEVEVRIPFKSLRYQSAERQDWGISIIRQVQATGHEDSWSPAQRAAPTFLGQGGRLAGLHGLHRGLVMDVSPVLTARATGAPGPDGRWDYGGGDPRLGANLRWGITPNLTLNGTVRPDFAEVESDASQVVYDPRQALFFAERRPFFLDGLETFTTPNRLIYTRRLAEPQVATKLTGKRGGTSVGFISGLDDEALSATGENSIVYNWLRVQQDVGRQSRVGLVATHRIEGDRTNFVAGLDGNAVLGGVYSLQYQLANSWTTAPGSTISAPLWQGSLVRSGRAWAGRLLVRGLHEDFRAQSGFISRTGIGQVRLSNQLSVYGRPGSAFERGSTELMLEGTWGYQDLVHGRASQDRKLHVNQNVTLRGGWTLGASVLVESFGYDAALYQNVAVERTTGAVVDTIAYNDWVPTRSGRLPNLDYVVTVVTPRIAGLSLNGQVVWGQDENFQEWSSARIVIFNGGLQWRPTTKTRLDGTYVLQSYRRKSDGSTVSLTHIPRMRLEYQATRSVFIRLVGEYRYQRQDDLRDDSRSNDPLLIRNPATGTYQRDLALGFTRRTFRGDLLLSVVPSPGTVLYAGYGNTLRRPDRDGDIERFGRINDAFFLKLSYLFRTG